VRHAAAAAAAQVFEHGAHVTSWRNAAGDELLFVSKEVRRVQGSGDGFAAR
jgi:D-hexose-6-phosphate mutarotase